jgi:hypothetical protein
MKLVDTSAWVEFLRRKGDAKVKHAVGIGGFELIGLGKEGQTRLGRFWPPEFVGVQELFPLALARLHQNLSVGNSTTKSQVKGLVQSSKACYATG